jgi:hypothetical protein
MAKGKKTYLELQLEKLMPSYTPSAYKIILKGWEKVIKPELLKKIASPDTKKIIKELE